MVAGMLALPLLVLIAGIACMALFGLALAITVGRI